MHAIDRRNLHNLPRKRKFMRYLVYSGLYGHLFQQSRRLAVEPEILEDLGVQMSKIAHAALKSAGDQSLAGINIFLSQLNWPGQALPV